MAFSKQIAGFVKLANYHRTPLALKPVLSRTLMQLCERGACTSHHSNTSTMKYTDNRTQSQTLRRYGRNFSTIKNSFHTFAVNKMCVGNTTTEAVNKADKEFVQSYIQETDTTSSEEKTSLKIKKIQESIISELQNTDLKDHLDGTHITDIIETLIITKVKSDDIVKLLTETAELMHFTTESVINSIRLLKENGFSAPQIAELIHSTPELVERIGKNQNSMFGLMSALQGLGFHQGKLQSIVTQHPQLFDTPPSEIMKQYTRLLSFFRQTDLKRMIMSCPQLLTQSWREIEEKVYYIDEEMSMDQLDIVKSNLFDYSLQHLMARHEFLKRAGLYRKEMRKKTTGKENLISLKQMIETSDKEFAHGIAGMTLAEYKVFVEMIAQEIETQRSYEAGYVNDAYDLDDLDDTEFFEMDEQRERQILKKSYKKKERKY